MTQSSDGSGIYRPTASAGALPIQVEPTMVGRVAQVLERFLPPHLALVAARDAILSMREPTHQMIDAGWRENDASPAACWRAMITAAT